jgi:hypothetical protein
MYYYTYIFLVAKVNFSVGFEKIASIYFEPCCLNERVCGQALIPAPRAAGGAEACPGADPDAPGAGGRAQPRHQDQRRA